MTPLEDVRNTIRLDGLDLLDEPVKLASGEMSDWYIDLRPLLLNRVFRTQVGECLWSLVRNKNFNVLAGPMSGACPVVIAIQNAAGAQKRYSRIVRVRKAAKGHGKDNLVIGRITPPDKVIVVEDVLTTGGSALRAKEAIEAAGGEVVGFLSIVNRKSLKELEGLPVTSLFYGKNLDLSPVEEVTDP